MNFLEAMKEMSGGKKVRRIKWKPDDYWYMVKNRVLRCDGTFASFSLRQVEAVDWLLHPEDAKPVPLSDKFRFRIDSDSEKYYAHSDVKAALLELDNFEGTYRDGLSELFGEDFIDDA